MKRKKGQRIHKSERKESRWGSSPHREGRLASSRCHRCSPCTAAAACRCAAMCGTGTRDHAWTPRRTSRRTASLWECHGGPSCRVLCTECDWERLCKPAVAAAACRCRRAAHSRVPGSRAVLSTTAGHACRTRKQGHDRWSPHRRLGAGRRHDTRTAGAL